MEFLHFFVDDGYNTDDWWRRRRRNDDNRLMDDHLGLVFQQFKLEFLNLHVVHFFVGRHGPGAGQEDHQQAGENLRYGNTGLSDFVPSVLPLVLQYSVENITTWRFSGL